MKTIFTQSSAVLEYAPIKKGNLVISCRSCTRQGRQRKSLIHTQRLLLFCFLNLLGRLFKPSLDSVYEIQRLTQD